MKIYVNTDLEGVCGFVDWDEATVQTGRGIHYAKECLTAEVNAAIEGVLTEDPKAEILVQDGHGGGWWGVNIIGEKLHPKARLIIGKRIAELAGLTADFDLLIAIGVHSMAGTRYGCMNHTLSIDTIMNIWINGVVVGELGIWAAAAGHYGVPIGMLSGDYWAVEEAKTLLGHVIGVPVKKGINRYTAECYNLDESRQQIKEAARIAVATQSTFKPYILTPPVEVIIEYTNTFHADKAEMGGAERLGGRTVRHTGNDFPSVYARFS